MNHFRTARRWTLIATIGVAFGVAAVACSDDDTADPTTTVPETGSDYLTRVQAECPGFQPGFDVFYSEHPTPTAADYAAFLPSQIDGLQAQDDCIVASRPPAELTDGVKAVTDAMDVVIADLQKAQDAAEADDLAGTDQWVTQMHEVDVAKIDEAIQALMASVGS